MYTIYKTQFGKPQFDLKKTNDVFIVETLLIINKILFFQFYLLVSSSLLVSLYVCLNGISKYIFLKCFDVLYSVTLLIVPFLLCITFMIVLVCIYGLKKTIFVITHLIIQ